LFVQSSLFNTLVVSGLCSLTVVPAAIGVSGTALPEAAQAVAAFGQLMLVALWTATLMGPRIMQLRKEHQQLAGKVAQTVVQLQRISSAVKPVQPGASLNIGEQIGMALPDYVEQFHPVSSALGPDHSAKPLSHSAAKAELIQGDPNVLSANPMSGAASPQRLSASDARYHMPGLASQPNSSVAATHGSDPISILPFSTPATTPESDFLAASQQRALQQRVPYRCRPTIWRRVRSERRHQHLWSCSQVRRMRMHPHPLRPRGATISRKVIDRLRRLNGRRTQPPPPPTCSPTPPSRQLSMPAKCTSPFNGARCSNLLSAF
jgi:hypothetical protein